MRLKKKAYSDIMTTFLFVIFLIIALIALVGVGLSITGLKIGFEKQSSDFSEIMDAKSVVFNCLTEVKGNYTALNDCLGENFIGDYVSGVKFEEVYGDNCNETFELGNQTDNVYVYWSVVNDCLVKVLISDVVLRTT